MAWTTPKTDWIPNDVVSSADLNQVGANLNVLRNTIFIAGSAPDQNGLYYYDLLYQTAMVLAAGQSLILRRYGHNFTTHSLGGGPMYAKISVTGGATYTPTGPVVETMPDTTLYTNATASPVTVAVVVTPVTGGGYPWDAGSGFHATLEIV